MKRFDSGMSRRDFMKTGLTAAAALPVVATLVRPGVARAELVTELPDQAAMVGALQYVNESTKPDQNCTNCQFYTPGEGGVGKCQLFPVGNVAEKGWCASWAKKLES